MAQRTPTQPEPPLTVDDYRTLVENANDAIAIVRLDGVITYANRGAERLLGWAVTDLVGQHVRKVATPASIALAEARTRQYLAGQRPDTATFEAELVRKDGSLVPVEVRTRVMRDAQGQPVAFQGVYRDLTDRKRAEAALQQSQRFNTQIADTIPDMLYLYDLELRRIVYVNRQVEVILGYPPPQMLKKSPAALQRLIHPDDLLKVIPAAGRWMTGPEGQPVETEFRVKHADGEWRWLCSRETVFTHTASGAPRQVLGTAQNITHRKRLEELLGERVINRQMVAARVRQFRERLALSQAEFGQMFGEYGQRQISFYERGKVDVPLDLLLAIRNKGYPLEVVLGAGTTAVIDQTISYLSTAHGLRQVARTLAQTLEQILERDAQTVATLLKGLGIPPATLSRVAREQQQLLSQVMELEKEEEGEEEEE